MIPPSLFQDLRGIVGPDHVYVDETTAEVYSYDASLFSGVPGAVITQRVAAIVMVRPLLGRRPGRPVRLGWRSGLNWYYSTALRI